MKLFLASALDKTLPALLKRLDKPASELRVLFIANAADPIKEEAWWVEADRKALKDAGCKLVEVDLKSTAPDELTEQMRQADLLHICGGSVLYITDLLHKTGLLEVIQKAVQSEKVVYTGTSAGSIIAASDVSLYAFDLEEKELVQDLRDFSGFSFVPFIIKPHVGNKENHANLMMLMEHAGEQSLPVLLLRDTQAVWVEDDELEIVSV